MRGYGVNHKAYKLYDKQQEIFITVIPAFGGILTQINVKGREILYLKSDLLEKKDIMAGGIPYLFPICGSLKDEKYSIKGKEYFMPGHGFAKNMPWDIVPEITSEKSISMRLLHNDETLKYYPFRFEVILTYELSEGMLIVRQKIINNSDTRMPFYSGFHPFFNVTDKESLTLNINATDYIDYYTGKTCKYDGRMDFEKEIDYIFYGIKKLSHSFTNPKDEYMVKMHFDENIKTLVFWTLKGEPFICLEPWMNDPDTLNTGEELFFIGEGERQIIEMGIEIKTL